MCFIQITPAASGRKKPEGKHSVWKGDKAGAATPIQAGSAEALKAFKHMTGGRGRVQRTLGGGLTGVEREGSLKGNSQLPCKAPGKKMLPGTATGDHAGETLEMLSTPFHRPG